MKLVAHVLHSLGDTKRTLFLYDTFEGMTEPQSKVLAARLARRLAMAPARLWSRYIA
jgi:hypothetical protein